MNREMLDRLEQVVQSTEHIKPIMAKDLRVFLPRDEEFLELCDDRFSYGVDWGFNMEY